MIPMADTHLSEPEIEAALRVLRSGALRQGHECDTFEEEFATLVGVRHAVTCANGSAALHLAYAALLQPGDEVLVPSFTFFATAGMAIQSGLKPILCDVDPETYLIDLKDAERKITKKTRAIVPVHLFGNVCPEKQTRAFAEAHHLRIIWDAAQSQGASDHGMDVGRFDSLVCYSFYPTKNLFVGEGGMVTTMDDDLAYRIRYLRTHGQTAKYLHTMIGWNYRMTDVEGAIGRAQLARFPVMMARRRENAKILREGLQSLPGLSLQRITEGTVHAWHQFCFTVDQERFGLSRDELTLALKERGVSSGVHYPRGVHQQPVIQDLYGKKSLPVTEKLTETILAVPVHHGVSPEEAHQIVQAVRSAAGHD